MHTVTFNSNGTLVSMVLLEVYWYSRIMCSVH